MMDSELLDELIDVVYKISTDVGPGSVGDRDIIHEYLKDLKLYQTDINDYTEPKFHILWNSVIYSRINFINRLIVRFNVKDKQLLLNRLLNVSNKLKRGICLTPTPILFGQMRIAECFASDTVNTPDRLKGIGGTKMRDVPNWRLAEGYGWPIKLFYDGGRWIAINNRGLAVHCIKNIQPKRLIPVLLNNVHASERSRLLESKDKSEFTYDPSAKKRLCREGTKRILPSNEIPITSGPNNFNTLDVVEFPIYWLM